MANIVLQSQDLINASGKILSSADELSESLKKLDTLMASVENVWRDQNSKVYMDRYNELKKEFPQFENDVRSYGIFLNNVVETYKREFIDEVSTSVNSTVE